MFGRRHSAEEVDSIICRGRQKPDGLKASRFGVFLRSTLSWWRSVRISASSELLIGTAE
jgi:hypothetical protein